MNRHDVQPGRRQINMSVYGDTAAELEFAALDKARAVFGEDVRLEVDPVYQVNEPAFPEKACGKSWSSAITVYTIAEEAS